MIAGAVLLFLGAPLFAGVLFGHGGVRKSAQFRVLGELMRGVHGSLPRALLMLSFLLIVVGSCVTFAAVGAGDRARAKHCEATCTEAGYSTARIGPNSDRVQSDRTTWFVACICEEPGREPLESRAVTPAP